MMTLASGSPTLPTPPPPPTPAQDAFRDAARQIKELLAGGVADQLRSLPASEWETPLWRLYERLQETARDLMLWEPLALYRAARE